MFSLALGRWDACATGRRGGFGDISLEIIIKLCTLVTLRLLLTDSNVAGVNAESGKIAGEPTRSDRFALTDFRPRSLFQLNQSVNKVFTEYAFAGEDFPNIGEQHHPQIFSLILAGGQFDKCISAPARPIATSGLGDFEQWPPVVSDAIKKMLRQLWIARGDVPAVVENPTRQFSIKLRFIFDMLEIEKGALLYFLCT